MSWLEYLPQISCFCAQGVWQSIDASVSGAWYFSTLNTVLMVSLQGDSNTQCSCWKQWICFPDLQQHQWSKTCRHHIGKVCNWNSNEYSYYFLQFPFLGSEHHFAGRKNGTRKDCSTVCLVCVLEYYCIPTFSMTVYHTSWFLRGVNKLCCCDALLAKVWSWLLKSS